MSLSVSINGSTVNYKVNSWQVVNANDLTKTCSFVVEDAVGTTRYTHRMPVVCSDSTNGVLFAGFIDEPDESNLYPNAQNEISITCMDYRSLALKRRPTKDYTNMQAGDVAIDMVSNYLAAEGVTAGYAYRHISTNTDWNTGTLSGTVGALNVGDGDLELTRAGSTTTKTFSTNTDWNTGTLTSLDAQNNMLNLHASNALKYTGTCIGNLGNTYAYWEFWAGSYTIASGDMLQYDVWISSTSPEIKAAVDLTMSDGNTMRDFNGQACHDNYNIHAHPGSDLKGFADDQWYSRTVQLTALNGKTASFATIAFEGDNGGNYVAYFKNIKIVNSTFVTQVTLYDGTSHPYQPQLVAIGQNYVVGNNGYVNLAVTNATVYDQIGTWLSPAISIDAAKIVCTSLLNWTSSIPTGATAGAQTSGSNAPATPTGTSITIYSSIDNKATWQAANFKQSIPNLMAGFKVASRNMYLKAVLAISNPSPEVSPLLKSLTSTITSSWTQTKTDSITTAQTQTDFNTGNYTGTGWNGYLSGAQFGLDNGVALAGLLENWDYAATLPGNMSQFSSGSPASGTLNRKQFNVQLSTGTDWRGRFDSIGSNLASGSYSANYQNFSAQISFSFPDVSRENGAGLAYRTTNWGTANDSYAYAASMITNKGGGSTPNTGNTVLELSKGTNSTGAGSYTNLGFFTLPFTPSNGTTYTLKIVINGSSHKLYLDDVLYLTVTDATYSAAGQIAARYYNNTGATQTAVLDNFGVVALQPSGGLFTGTWDNGAGINVNAIGTVGASLLAWDADVPSGCSVTAQVNVNGSGWVSATNGATIPGLTPGQGTSGFTGNVQVKFTLTSTYPSITPVLKGWTIWLTTQTSASGTRISPALAITSVGRIGSSSITLNSLIPANTNASLDASFSNLGPWTSVNSSLPNGNYSAPVPLALISPQPDPYLDFFSANTSGNYTQTNIHGGAATWTWDTANTRLTATQTTNVRGVLKYATISAKDMFAEDDFNYSDSGGLVVRMVDTNNAYFLTISDASASSSPNSLRIRKVVAGATPVTIGTLTTISFTRGEYHRFRLDIQGSTLTASMDSKVMLTATDTDITAAGSPGILCGVNNGNQIQCYSFRAQAYGDNKDGQSVYTRLTLNSTDPTSTPQLQDITTAIHSTAIGTGALIPQTDYAYKNTCAASFDDLASQSTTATNTQWQWDIDTSKAFSLHHAYANPAPFYVWSSTNGNISWGLGAPGMQRPDMLYRNRQIIKGGVDTSTTDTRSFVGDGQTQTWTLPYPVDSIVSITLDNNSTLVGVRGTDTGKDFYYLQGDQVISQDSNGTILANTDTLTVAYVPQIPVRVTVDNTGVNNSSSDPITVSLPGTTTISQLAAITSDTGIVEDYLEVSGLSKAAAIQRAKGLLQQYGVLGRNITFTVKKFGLAPGQLVNVTMPQHGIYNGVFLISKVTIKAMQAAGSDPDIINGILYTYTIEASEGASTQQWEPFFAKMAA